MSTNADGKTDGQQSNEGQQGKVGGASTGPDGSTGHTDGSASKPDDGKKVDESPNAREARYRTERNEARSEVERLTGVVESLQRSAVMEVVGDQVPARALFAVTDLAALIADDGAVNREAVDAAVKATVEEFGLGPQKPQPNQFLGDETNSGGSSAADQWTSAFGPS